MASMSSFDKMVSTYEHRVGHICRQVASSIPSLLTSFPSTGSLLDDACGTGIVTEEFLKVFPHAKVSAIDVSPAMVDAFRSVINKSPHLTTQVEKLCIEDAQHLPFPNNSFDAAIMNFGIFLLPEPLTGVKEIYRTLKPGGTAVLTAWKTFGFQPILDQVQSRIKPTHPLTDLPPMGAWCRSDKLSSVMRDAGFASVELHSVEAGLWGADVEDFKSVLLESFHMFVAKSWPDDEKTLLAPTTSQVVDDMLLDGDEACVKNGKKIGCLGEAWVAVASRAA